MSGAAGSLNQKVLPSPRCALDPDTSAEPLDDPADDRQPEPVWRARRCMRPRRALRGRHRRSLLRHPARGRHA